MTLALLTVFASLAGIAAGYHAGWRDRGVRDREIAAALIDAAIQAHEREMDRA